MRMSLTKVCCIASLVFCSITSYAHDSLTYIYFDFPPYIYTDGAGQAKGVLAEVVENVFSRANVKYEMYENPNRRASQLVNDGRLTFSIAPTFVLNNPGDFLIGKNTIATIELAVFWHGDTAPVSKIDELVGHSIILMSAYRYDGLREFADNRANKVTIAVNAENHLSALQALKAGRGDYLIDYRKPIEDALSKEPIASLRSTTISEFEMKFIILRSAFNAEAIMARLEKAYAEIYMGQ